LNINIVIPQIRTLATVFSGNVAGAAGYANAVADQVYLPLPAAYVVPGDEAGGENQSATGLVQSVEERIAVIVILQTLNVSGAEDLSDRRAQAAANSLHEIRASLFRAILNWRPDFDVNPATNNEARGFRYVGGQLLDFDRARYFYQFDFALDTLITDDDGWRVPSDPLIDIHGTVTTDLGAPPLEFDVTFPPPA
jgi:hypothetical protein